MIDPAHPDFLNTPVAAARPSFEYALLDASTPPFASIVTPFFNTGAVFRETARSVLRQSLQQWEWLIINDGSTDREALAMLAEYRQGDPRIRVIDHAENRGLSAARNTGFRAARAPYVVQLDSDDLLEPTAVEKWCWYLESHPERAFVKGYTVQFGASQCLWPRGFHEGTAFLVQNLVNPTSAVRKEVHHAVQGYDEADRGGLMDWDFWLPARWLVIGVALSPSTWTGIGDAIRTTSFGQTSMKGHGNGRISNDCKTNTRRCGKVRFPGSWTAITCRAPFPTSCRARTAFDTANDGCCCSLPGCAWVVRIGSTWSCSRNSRSGAGK